MKTPRRKQRPDRPETERPDPFGIRALIAAFLLGSPAAAETNVIDRYNF